MRLESKVPARTAGAASTGTSGPDDPEDADELIDLIETLEPPADLTEAVEELVRATLLMADVSVAAPGPCAAVRAALATADAAHCRSSARRAPEPRGYVSRNGRRPRRAPPEQSLDPLGEQAQAGRSAG